MKTPTKADVIEIMHRYNVRSHYRATATSHGTRYAVFGPQGQMTEPWSHGDAVKERDQMIAADILALFGVAE